MFKNFDKSCLLIMLLASTILSNFYTPSSYARSKASSAFFYNTLIKIKLKPLLSKKVLHIYNAINEEIMPTYGFSWVVQDSLAGMPKPGVYQSLDSDLFFLKNEGLDLLVSLTEEPIPDNVASLYEIKTLHIPVKDFTAPTLDQITLFISEASKEIKKGNQVGVHCLGGKGRTGTFLAAYFVFQGMLPEEAIDLIKELRPGSIETAAQEAVIYEYYYLLQ